MNERVYLEGDIWEDKDLDEWVVHPDGLLYNEIHDWYREPKYVESRWGPLFLKRPVEDNELPMTDWEEELIEASNPLRASGISAETLNKLDSVFVGYAIWTYEEALSVLLKKNADYGSKNIGNSPGGALNGLRVRLWDKMARLVNLTELGVQPENESLRDTALDMMNYSAIMLMVLDGKWPGIEEVNNDQSSYD